MNHKQIIKDVARKCFECAKESSRLDNAIREFGIVIDNSPLDDIFYHHMRVLEVFTPDDVANDDAGWFNDLTSADYDDFEAFWSKYYEGRI